MSEEVEALEAVSTTQRSERLKAQHEAYQAMLSQVIPFGGFVLPHHFEGLIGQAAADVAEAANENHHRSMREVKQWHRENLLRDHLWRIRNALHPNSILNRQVTIIH